MVPTMPAQRRVPRREIKEFGRSKPISSGRPPPEILQYWFSQGHGTVSPPLSLQERLPSRKLTHSDSVAAETHVSTLLPPHAAPLPTSPDPGWEETFRPGSRVRFGDLLYVRHGDAFRNCSDRRGEDFGRIAFEEYEHHATNRPFVVLFGPAQGSVAEKSTCSAMEVTRGGRAGDGVSLDFYRSKGAPGHESQLTALASLDVVRLRYSPLGIDLYIDRPLHVRTDTLFEVDPRVRDITVRRPGRLTPSSGSILLEHLSRNAHRNSKECETLSAERECNSPGGSLTTKTMDTTTIPDVKNTEQCDHAAEPGNEQDTITSIRPSISTAMEHTSSIHNEECTLQQQSPLTTQDPITPSLERCPKSMSQSKAEGPAMQDATQIEDIGNAASSTAPTIARADPAPEILPAFLRVMDAFDAAIDGYSPLPNPDHLPRLQAAGAAIDTMIATTAPRVAEIEALWRAKYGGTERRHATNWPVQDLQSRWGEFLTRYETNRTQFRQYPHEEDAFRHLRAVQIHLDYFQICVARFLRDMKRLPGYDARCDDATATALPRAAARRAIQYGKDKLARTKSREAEIKGLDRDLKDAWDGMMDHLCDFERDCKAAAAAAERGLVTADSGSL